VLALLFVPHPHNTIERGERSRRLVTGKKKKDLIEISNDGQFEAKIGRRGETNCQNRRERQTAICGRSKKLKWILFC
jgi:hypothetical protein